MSKILFLSIQLSQHNYFFVSVKNVVLLLKVISKKLPLFINLNVSYNCIYYLNLFSTGRIVYCYKKICNIT